MTSTSTNIGSSASPHASNLSAVATGQAAEVVEVVGHSALAQRLRDLGFWPGAIVTVVRRAPLGDPMEVMAHGCRLALRANEAGHIRVKSIPGFAKEMRS